MINNHIIFETERLIVRQYAFEIDTENFFLLNGDDDVMRYIRATKTKEECDVFLKKAINAYKINPLIGRWAADEKVTGKFVGSFAIIPIESSDDIQLGYALLKEYWGKGFASELTKSGLAYYFKNTNADHIYAIAEKANITSHKVLLKNSFVTDGTKMEDGKELLKFIYRKLG
ncbi:MAG TPA: GNAT family N-acetyltransferase [Chitinophagaceae bacterium]|nr:GNAT family N-acetyltransferase [Chitinophagaceae bacterium]